MRYYCLVLWTLLQLRQALGSDYFDVPTSHDLRTSSASLMNRHGPMGWMNVGEMCKTHEAQTCKVLEKMVTRRRVDVSIESRVFAHIGSPRPMWRTVQEEHMIAPTLTYLLSICLTSRRQRKYNIRVI